MKRISLALCALLCLFVSAIAVADDYVPIQPYHSGMWADISSNGEGFNVYVSPDPVRAISVLSFLDAKFGNDLPTWYYSQETPTRPATYLTIFRVTGGEYFAQNGIGVVESRGCDSLSILISVGLMNRVYDVQRLIPPAPGLSCYSCAAGDTSASCTY